MGEPKDTREHADSYRKQASDEGEIWPKAKKPTRSLAQWETAANEAISEAMKGGAFDNLPGKGKPLNLGKDPFTPSDSALAFDILKNNELTPPWLSLRNDLQREIEKWRSGLRETVAQANSAWMRAHSDEARANFSSRWLVQRSSCQAQVEAINRRIGTVNLQLPSVAMEIFKLRLDEEIARAGATFQFREDQP